MIGFVQNGWDLTHAIIARYEQYWHNEFGRRSIRTDAFICEIIQDYRNFQRCFFIFYYIKSDNFLFVSSRTLRNFFSCQYIEAEQEVIGVEIFEITLLTIEGSCVWRSRQRCMKGSRGPISLQFSFFFRYNLWFGVFFRDQCPSRRPAFPFRYIEQCSASRQPLQSPFNYFINNHYCPVYYGDQLSRRVKFDDHIFQVNFTNQKICPVCLSHVISNFSLKKRNESSF